MKTIEKIKKRGYKVTFVSAWRNGTQSIAGIRLNKDGGICVDGPDKFFPSATQALNYVTGKNCVDGLKF